MDLAKYIETHSKKHNAYKKRVAQRNCLYLFRKLAYLKIEFGPLF